MKKLLISALALFISLARRVQTDTGPGAADAEAVDTMETTGGTGEWTTLFQGESVDKWPKHGGGATQVEIEAGGADGAESGYIYGEALDTGWLKPEEELQPHTVFRDGEWNEYRVVAGGPSRNESTASPSPTSPPRRFTPIIRTASYGFRSTTSAM